MHNNLYLNCFNRFSNYLIKVNSPIRFKVENNNIMFCAREPYYNKNYEVWFLRNKLALETQIDYFFFGDIRVKSIFSWFGNNDIFKIFGKPCCLEELILKMDLMGI